MASRGFYKDQKVSAYFSRVEQRFEDDAARAAEQASALDALPRSVARALRRGHSGSNAIAVKMGFEVRSFRLFCSFVKFKLTVSEFTLYRVVHGSLVTP